MRRIKNRKVLVIAIFLLTIVSVSMGYSLLSRTLKINGASDIKQNTWDIHFNNVSERCYSISADTPAYIVDEKKTIIDFSVTIGKPGEIYSFDADIVNDGTIDAMIESVEKNGVPEELKNYLEWDVRYLSGDEIERCDELLHESSRKIRVTVKYSEDVDEDNAPDPQDLNLSLVINYVQLNNNTCVIIPTTPDPTDDPVCGEHTLTINPNGGIYDGKTENTIVMLKLNDTYDVLVPTRDGFNFTGWTVSESGVYANNKVTMGENNVTMTANWTEMANNDRTISIDPNGGTYKGNSGITVENVVVGDEYNIVDPVWEDHEFLGWTVTPGETYDDETDIITVGEENVTTVAEWKDLRRTISIDPNGGTYKGNADITVENVLIGDEYNIVDPVRDGYRFVGWTVTPTETYDDENDKITVGEDNITTVAEWEEIPKLTLTIDPNEGVYNGETSATIVLMDTDDTYEMLEATYEGFEFDHWEVSVDGVYNEETGIVTMGTQNITMIAHWKDTNVPLDSVARIKRVYYPTIQEAFDDAIEDDVIHMLKSTTESPTNNTNDSITLDLEGFTVTGKMTNNGDLRLLNGKLTNEEDLVFVNNGDLKLGKDDGNVIVEDSIQLVGDEKSLQQNGTFSFYDGFLLASDALDGDCNEVPENYYVFVDHYDNKQKIYPTRGSDRAIAKTEKNNITTLYFNLQDAFDVSMNENLTVTSVRDFESLYELHVDEGKSVDYVVGNYTVNLSNSLTNNGTLNITGSGKAFGIMTTITNNGTLNLDNLNVSRFDNTVSNIDNYGTLKMVNSSLNGGKVSNYSNSDMDIDATSKITELYNGSDADFNLLNGKYTHIVNDGKLTLKNGDVSLSKSNADAITIENTGTFVVDGGRIRAITSNSPWKDAIAINGGTVIVNGGELSSSSTGSDYHETETINADKVTMNGGKVVAYSEGCNKYDCGSSVAITAKELEFNDGEVVASAPVNDTSMTVIAVKGGGSDKNVINGGTLRAIGKNAIAASYVYYINGGDFESDNICVSSSTTNVNDGTFTCGGIGIYATYGSANGGTVSSVDDAIKLYVINYQEVDFTITGGRYVSSSGNGVSSSRGILNIGASDDADVNDYPYIEGYINGVDAVYGSVDVTVDNVIVVSKTGYGIDLKSGLLTLGKNDGIIDQVYPSVIGDSYGVFNDDVVGISSIGTFKMFDGKIEGKVDTHYGQLNALADGAQIIKGTNDDVTFEYLERVANFARVGSTEFNSLNDAIDSIDETGIIEIIGDASIYSENVIPDDKDITIDLNGHEIDVYSIIENNGILRIKDSGTNGKIVGKIDSFINTKSGASLFFDSGNIVLDNKKLSSAGKITTNGGSFELDGTGASIVLDRTDFEMNGGQIVADFDEVVNPNDIRGGCIISGGNNIVINDVNITATGKYYSVITTEYRSSVTISDSYIDVSLDNNYYYDSETSFSSLITSGYITISNTTFNAAFPNDNLGGYLITFHGGSSVSNSTMSSSSNCLYSSTGTVPLTIDGGTYTCGRNGIAGDNVTINDINMTTGGDSIIAKGNIIINDGTIISSNGNGINTNRGTIKIGTEGEGTPSIIAKTNAINISGNGSVTIGQNDSSVSGTSPLLRGENIALYFAETVPVYVYDGILQGGLKAYNIFVTGTPDGYTLMDRTDVIDGVNYKTAYLDEVGDFLKIGQTTYSSFDDAISAATGSDTIDLLYSVTSTTAVEIPKEKSITFNFNGNSLRMTQPITNNGTLNLINSTSETGGIIALADNILINKGTLNIYDGFYSGKSILINNSFYGAILHVYDGTFTVDSASNSSDVAVINSNNGSSSVVIDDGSYTSHYSGPQETYEKNAFIVVGGNIEINGGTFDVSSDNTVGLAFYSLNNNVTMNDGTINSSHDGIFARNLNMTGGNLTCGRYGIGKTVSRLVGFKGDFNITGGTVNSVLTAVTGNGTITGGTFVSSDEYGLVPGNTVIGENDGSINTTSPVFIGGLYGIYNSDNDSTKFYDGVAKGMTGAIYSSFNDLETDAVVHTETENIEDNQYYVSYLVINEIEIENVNTGVRYRTLKSAIEDVNPEEVLRLLNDVNVYNDIVIEENMNVTFDLNGHDMTLFRKLTNNGVLNVKDGTKTDSSLISNTFDITNNGTMNISDLNFYLSDFLVYGLNSNKSSSKSITNTGNLTISSCSLNFENGSLYNSSYLKIDNTTMDYVSYSTLIVSRERSETHIVNGSTLIGSVDFGDVAYIEDSAFVSKDDAVSFIGNEWRYPLYITDSSIDANIWGGNIHVTGSSLKSIRYTKNVEVSDSTIDGTISISDGSDYDLTLNNVILNTDSLSPIDIKGNAHISDTTFNIERVEAAEENGATNLNVIKFSDGVVESSGNHYNVNYNATKNQSVNIVYAYRSNGTTQKIVSEGDTVRVVGAPKLKVFYSDSEVSNGGLFVTGADILVDSASDYVTQQTYAVYSLHGDLSVTDSTIVVNNSYTTYGLYSTNSDVTFDNNTLTINSSLLNSSTNDYGLYLKNGSLTMPSSKIHIYGCSDYYGSHYGIYANSTTVSIGTHDGSGTQSASIDTEDPYIEVYGNGTAIPIYKYNGSLSIYDGFYKGKTGTITGEVNGIEDNFDLIEYYDRENDLYYVTFEYMDSQNHSAVVRVNNKLYTSMYLAMKYNSSGTFTLLQNVEDDIILSTYNMTLDLNGTTYTGKITIPNGKNLTIMNGTIVGVDDEPAIVNEGTLIIGENDSNILEENVLITSNGTAVVGNGTIKMYDGTIRGLEGATDCEIADFPVGHDIYIETKNIIGTDYVVAYIGDARPFAMVGETEYNSLADAIAAITSEGTIKVINSNGVISGTVYLPSGKDITLDLNNNTLTFRGQLRNEGILRIVDNSSANNGKINSRYDYAIFNSGKMYLDGIDIEGNHTPFYSLSGANTYLYIDDVNINLDVNGTTTVYAFYSYTWADVTNLSIEANIVGSASFYALYNGFTPQSYEQSIKFNSFSNIDIKVTADENYTGSVYGVYNYGPPLTLSNLDIEIDSPGYNYYVNGSNLIIDDFDFELDQTYSSTRTSYCFAGGAITASNGTVNMTNDYSIYGGNYANLTLDNVEMNLESKNSYVYGIYGDSANVKNSTINVSGLNSSIGVYSKNGIIKDSNIYAENYNGTAFAAELYGDSSVQGGKLEAKGLEKEGYYSSARALNVTGGTVTVDGTEIISNYYGIETSGTLTLLSGSVTSDVRGINCSSTSSVINIGQKDGTYNNSPVIIGKDTGINSVGTVNFYDGVVKGTVSAIGASINEVEDGMTVITNTETIDGDDYIVNTLG